MFFLTLGGCGDKADTSTETGCFGSAPEAEIGSGESEWVSLSEGDPVTMVHGPQGGWHMLGSLWAANLEQIVEIEFTITVEREYSGIGSTLRVPPRQADPCSTCASCLSRVRGHRHH
jgi:hypothetical protein